MWSIIGDDYFERVMSNGWLKIEKMKDNGCFLAFQSRLLNNNWYGVWLTSMHQKYNLLPTTLCNLLGVFGVWTSIKSESYDINFAYHSSLVLRHTIKALKHKLKP